MLLFADNLRHGRQRDFGGSAFQSLSSFPGRFCAREGYGVARVGLDPVTKFGLVLRTRAVIEPGQQACGFRLDRVPAAAT